MRISVNLFAVSITPDNYIMLIYPSTFPTVELGYSFSEHSHVGSFVLPYTMQYSTLRGIKSISTASTYNFNTGKGYLSIFIITVFDSDGGTDNFVIILQIQQGAQFDPTLLIIIISIISLIVIFIVVYSVRHRKKKKSIYREQPWQYSASSYSISNDQKQPYEKTPKNLLYCPFCGQPIHPYSKFCTSCGKSLEFTSKE